MKRMLTPFELVDKYQDLTFDEPFSYQYPYRLDKYEHLLVKQHQNHDSRYK